MKCDVKEKTIAGMPCVCRELAAERIGMSVSWLDKHLAACRTKKYRPKVALKFYQVKKGGPVWFPIVWLDEFVKEVALNGGIA